MSSWTVRKSLWTVSASESNSICFLFVLICIIRDCCSSCTAGICQLTETEEEMSFQTKLWLISVGEAMLGLCLVVLLSVTSLLELPILIRLTLGPALLIDVLQRTWIINQSSEFKSNETNQLPLLSFHLTCIILLFPAFSTRYHCRHCNILIYLNVYILYKVLIG